MNATRYRFSLGRAVLTIVGYLLILVTSARAQYTADFQTNIISGVTSNWTGDYVVGSNTFADALLIQNSGVLSNGYGYLGYETSSSNNSVVVGGTGSVWSNACLLYVGYSGAGNSLVISNGGKVFNGTVVWGGEETVGGIIGYNSSNNSVLVTGEGSMWSSGDNLQIGYSGAGNRLVVNKGGTVFTGSGSLGSENASALVTDVGSIWSNSSGLAVWGVDDSLVISNGGQVYSDGGYMLSWGSGTNCALVTGSGTVWNSGTLSVGYYGTENGLVIRDGGRITSSVGSVGAGFFFGASNNRVLVTGSGSIWSNQGTLFVGGAAQDDCCVGDGSDNSLLISNGGQVASDDGYVGYNSNSSDNSALVTGAGSVWNNNNNLYVGNQGAGNSLVISAGGQVFSGWGSVGGDAGASNNHVVITGPGSVWESGGFAVGSSGVDNNLLISNGGKLISGSYGWIGGDSGASNNCLVVTGSGSIWSNGYYIMGVSGLHNSLIVSNGASLVNDGWNSYIGTGIESDEIGSNNVAVVTGTGSVWRNNEWLLLNRANQLRIEDGGRVFSGQGFIGKELGDSAASVTGAGSVWSNSGSLYVGYTTDNDRLLISNGGQVFDDTGLVGAWWSTQDDSVLVTGPGAVWRTANELFIGRYGRNNSLVISNAAHVIGNYSYVGYGYDGFDYVFGNSNHVHVADGAVWQNNNLSVGHWGSSNSVVVRGGSVLATNLVIGFASAECNNLLQLVSGDVTVTNATGNAVLEVRNGSFIQNGGVVQADILVVTNACARFIRNGGALLYSQLVLDPTQSAVGDGIPNGWKQQYGFDPFDPTVANADPDGDGMTNLEEYQAGTNPTNSASVFRITEIWPDDADMFLTWTAVGGKRYALQTTTGDSGGFSNNFIDLNPVIIAQGSGETEVSVLHLGAATNAPARFYRVRLVP